ncbi:MAG: putative N-acetylmannosamine-6-phosphate 2-epimerase [Alphaproteobacteria bacterium]|nr:putative N-acetylmannosamine-6-phosphate 2-epimerase [Alphaproteobacteria bacterium]
MILPFATPALVVSCQARPDSPLHGPSFMAAMAKAAVQGGAKAIRANGPADIRAIRAATAAPIIGLNKIRDEKHAVYITPSLESARTVAEAGADMIAIDATSRPRAGEPVADLIRGIRRDLGKPVLADIDTLECALSALGHGADAVATTLAGYTESRAKSPGPDFDLLRQLVETVRVPVIAEGRIWTPEEVAHAFALGAAAVVIGTAITNPREITRRLGAAVPGYDR